MLPKAVFGGKGDLANFCPNCHRDYHEKLGRKNLRNLDPDFHYDFFAKWIAGALGVVALALMVWWAK